MKTRFDGATPGPGASFRTGRGDLEVLGEGESTLVAAEEQWKPAALAQKVVRK